MTYCKTFSHYGIEVSEGGDDVIMYKREESIEESIERLEEMYAIPETKWTVRYESQILEEIEAIKRKLAGAN